MTPSHYTNLVGSRSGEERGFILPLSVLLVLVLTISGTSFLHHDYLERRMAMNEVDNHGAFFLASAGIERARDAFKIPDDAFWTTMLNDPALEDPEPDARLCPDLSRGCVIPPFQTPSGDPVSGPFNIPFDETFDDGEYTVRAFNNLNDPGAGTTDTDQILTFRALGTVRGQQKLLEVTVKAVSGLKLINCDETVVPSQDCPAASPGTDTTSMEGREPASFPPELLPTFDEGFYREWTNFSWVVASISLPDNTRLTPEDNTFYFVDGDVTLRNTGVNDHVVIFSTGEVTVSTNVTLNNSIVVGLDGVSLNGGITISAPLPYPAIISGGTVHGNTGVTVTGTIYSIGPIDLRGGTYAEGVLIGIDGDVRLRGTTDVSDAGNIQYYDLMPGFDYPDELKNTVSLVGTWLELE
jgi:hypothetical protein